MEQVHTKEYIEIVRRDVESGVQRLSTRSGNTFICKDSFEVALWAAGGVLAACDAVMSGKIKNAFCAIRPPGHHATPNRGMGFCLAEGRLISMLEGGYNLKGLAKAIPAHIETLVMG